MIFDGSSLQAVKYGSFAKLPRDISRFPEWENTTVLRVQDLESRVFDVDELTDPAVVEPESVAIVNMSIQGVKVQKKSFNVGGSVSGKVISEEELASVPQFERLFREWVGPDDLMAGKFRVTAHDFAVAMMLLRHFKADTNRDGSLPTRRVGELWTALYKSGDIQRGWNHHRWKRIRDFLSAKGHIDWTDHRYQYGGLVGEKNVRGIACKWKITDEFCCNLEQVSLVSALNAGGASFVDTKIRNLIPTQGNGHYFKPKRFPLWVEREQKFWLRASDACEKLFAA